MVDSIIRLVFLLFLVLSCSLYFVDVYGNEDPLKTVTDLGALLAGVSGVLIAWRGLETWRRERESELAKRLAHELFLYRRSLHEVRFELNLPTDPQPLTDGEKINQYERQLRRWHASVALLSALEATLSEADLRWENKASREFRTVRDTGHVLFRAINFLVANENQRITSRSANIHMSDYAFEVFWNREHGANIVARRRIALGFWGDPNDEFSREIDEAFSGMTRLLKTKI